jgi:hypothetical protein
MAVGQQQLGDGESLLRDPGADAVDIATGIDDGGFTRDIAPHAAVLGKGVTGIR